MQYRALTPISADHAKRSKFLQRVAVTFSISSMYMCHWLVHLSGTVIRCAGPQECLMEGETFMVTCTRSLDMLIQSRIAVMSEDGAAKG